MKASLSWLKEYVPIQMGVSELADALTMVGLEVESVVDRYDFMKAVRVGRITGVRPHPHADKLRVCDVAVEDSILTVVCGAPNVAEGMLAPVALSGTRFPNGTVIKESSIRGVVSQGMLCSQKELGLGEDAAGIMVLDPSMTDGQYLSEALHLADPILEIGITPNRPDCLGIIGIAREIAGIQRTPLRYPECSIADSGNRIADFTSVVIESPEHCPRYTARLLFDVKIGPSPFWLQEKLLSVGLRPINNIVDVTNFVLMETGQPLHAFDFDRLAGRRIVVRTARDGSAFTTLDDKERTLSADTLMICDGEREVAIGGVMGGLNSEILPSTTRVLIESAYFRPVSIRKTAKRLGIKTEASHRFERGIDPEGTVFSLNRAARLMADVSGGQIVDGWIDVYPKPIPKRKVTVRLSRTNRLLGTGFSKPEFQSLLESIAFSVEPIDEDHLLVEVPSFRVDVERPEDLMEEAARLSGYQHIPVTFPALPAARRKTSPSLLVRERIRQAMVGFGFLEAINYSFIHNRFDDHLRLPEKDFRRQSVEILNPISDEQSRMRTTLIPGLLGSLQRNISQQTRSIRLFETGKAYISQKADDLPREIEMLAALWTGLRFEPGWYGRETPCDMFDLKGVMEGLFRKLDIPDYETLPIWEDICAYIRTQSAVGIRIAGRDIGYVGEVLPEALVFFDIHQTVFIAELNLDELLPFAAADKKLRHMPRYPASSRDFTLIVDKTIRVGDVLKCVRASGEKWVENVHLFDVFDKKPIPRGKKSISFRITYRSQKRTLKDEEVTNAHQKISELLLRTFHAQLP